MAEPRHVQQHHTLEEGLSLGHTGGLRDPSDDCGLQGGASGIAGERRNAVDFDWCRGIYINIYERARSVQ